MFRSLLTPLTARFAASVSPSVSEPEIVEETPEDFELDARIDSMRNALEEVKSVELDNVHRKLEVSNHLAPLLARTRMAGQAC
jgi:Lhr-like helicase